VVFSFVYICYSKNKLYVPIYSKFHSGWAYLALLLLVVAVVNALMGMLSKENLLLVTERLLFWINRIHIQLLVG
jgi:sugar phosphate permease